jgi:hypothetical protein
MAAWPSLAAAVVRVLEAVGVEPVWLDQTGPVREVLTVLAQTGARPSTPGELLLPFRPLPDPAVSQITVRLGSIGDLLCGLPAASTRVDRNALLGLQANVVAVVHALAVTTLSCLPPDPLAEGSRSLMRGVLVRTERFAAVPVAARAGRYEDVVAIGSHPGSLDAAVSGWVRATVEVLGSRLRVTQTAMQTAAGDAMILTAAAATVVAAANTMRRVPDGAARSAQVVLGDAHRAWRRLVSWPTSVRLGGLVDEDQTRASRGLRETITTQLRQDRDWLSPQRLGERFDLGVLLATMRRGLHGVGNVGVAHFQAMDRLVKQPGGLWLAAKQVTQPAYRGSDTITAATRRGWVPMPPGEPAGQSLLAAAKQALTTTTTAIGALDHTAGPATTSTSGRGRLRWERGRIVVDHNHAQPALFETVPPREAPSTRHTRNTPSPQARPTRRGPSR